MTDNGREADRPLSPMPGSRIRIVVNAVEHRISDPGVHGGFPPAGAARADRYAPGEAAAVHFAIEGRASQAGPIKDYGQTKNTILLIRHGAICSIERIRSQ